MLDLFVPRWLQSIIIFTAILWFFTEVLALIFSH